MRVPGDEYVAVELPLQRAEGLRVAPRHDLMAVAQAELELRPAVTLACGPFKPTCGFGSVDIDTLSLLITKS